MQAAAVAPVAPPIPPPPPPYVAAEVLYNALPGPNYGLRRIQGYANTLTVDFAGQLFLWNPDVPPTRSVLVKRQQEKDLLEGYQQRNAVDIPAHLAAGPELDSWNALVAHHAAQMETINLMYDRCVGLAAFQSLDEEVARQGVISSGRADSMNLVLEKESQDFIEPPAYGDVANLNARTRKDFLAMINNATFSGDKDQIMEQNTLVLILTSMKDTIEQHGLTEQAAQQLALVVFRGKAFSILVAYRTRRGGFSTFWSIIQALSRTVISPSSAVQQIAELKKKRIPSLKIKDVIADLLTLNHYALPPNQPKAERETQYQASVMRDLRDLVMCQYPSFMGQVQDRERECLSAFQAERADLESRGFFQRAATMVHDSVTALVTTMISLLQVQSEGDRVEYTPLDMKEMKLSRVDKRNRKGPRVNAITEVPRNNREGYKRSQPQGYDRPPAQQRTDNSAPHMCVRCGKMHGGDCRRYQQYCKMACQNCKAAGVHLYHYNNDCQENSRGSAHASNTDRAPSSRKQFSNGPRKPFNADNNQGNPNHEPIQPRRSDKNYHTKSHPQVNTLTEKKGGSKKPSLTRSQTRDQKNKN